MNTARQGRGGTRRLSGGSWLVLTAFAALMLSGASPVAGQMLRIGITPMAADNPADYAVILYNRNDPSSRDLATFYAEKRGIPWERVVPLDCPVREDITRQEYDDTIAGPLRAAFDARAWWTRTPDRPGIEPSSTVTANRIRFLAIMRGVPLRIAPAANYPGDYSTDVPPLKDQNAACVDSELAALGFFSRKISGLLPNPAFHAFTRFPQGNLPGVMYPARLDAPTGQDVRRMIEDSLATEKTGLWGRCYVDARDKADTQEPLGVGDRWLTKIATELAPRVLPTVFDNRDAQFPPAYPLEDAALYFGWYSQDPAGPFTRSETRFRPGAVACHIHSFSATSLRDPAKGWAAPLLDHGAAATLGNVYEPYLGLTTNLDVFAERLVDGYTFAESAWQATPALSWMNTVVGDPLYRPGKVWRDLQTDLSGDVPPPGEPALVTQGKAYYQGAQVWRNRGAAAGAAALEKSAGRLRSPLIYEGLAGHAAGAGDLARAVQAYEQAGKLYLDPADKIRVAISEAAALTRANQKDQAAALLTAARQRFADAPAAAALDAP